jgi:hypothetical protein
MLAASAKGAAVLRGVPLPPEQLEQRCRTAREKNLVQYIIPGYHGPWWPRDELALLGALPDDEVARRTGRSCNAVRVKRDRLGIPKPDRPAEGRHEG